MASLWMVFTLHALNVALSEKPDKVFKSSRETLVQKVFTKLVYRSIHTHEYLFNAG